MAAEAHGRADGAGAAADVQRAAGRAGDAGALASTACMQALECSGVGQVPRNTVTERWPMLTDPCLPHHVPIAPLPLPAGAALHALAAGEGRIPRQLQERQQHQHCHHRRRGCQRPGWL